MRAQALTSTRVLLTVHRTGAAAFVNFLGVESCNCTQLAPHGLNAAAVVSHRCRASKSPVSFGYYNRKAKSRLTAATTAPFLRPPAAPNRASIARETSRVLQHRRTMRRTNNGNRTRSSGGILVHCCNWPRDVRAAALQLLRFPWRAVQKKGGIWRGPPEFKMYRKCAALAKTQTFQTSKLQLATTLTQLVCEAMQHCNQSCSTAQLGSRIAIL
jgi:hypothetical protein